MAKYVQINTVPNLSTGNVMWRNRETRIAAGDECWTIWGRGRAAENDHEFKCATIIDVYLDALQTRIDGKAGFHSKVATKRLLKKLNEINPDIVHLHNLHGYYVNVEMLFEWLASHSCHVYWTLHDCWAFTGHCAYFTYAKCFQWQEHCACTTPCPQLSAYPKTHSRSSVKWNYYRKRDLFTMLAPDRLTLIVPSRWLASLINESFLNKYNTEVRYNTIDTSIFRPTQSTFRQCYKLENRFVVLCVASIWNNRKGLDDLIALSQRIDEDIALVIVGISKWKARSFPPNVICIRRTESQRELAELYSTADVFFNPSKEDNYPTVLLEARACNCRIITYDTGGCSEAAGNNAIVVHSLSEACSAIERLRSEARSK